jgi:hypothetical protein
VAEKADIRVKLSPEGVQEVTNALRRVQGEATRSGQTGARAMGAMTAAARTLARILPGISFAFLGREIFRRAIDAERTFNRMTTALRTTGFAAGITSRELDALAESIKRTTIFDDDQIRRAISALLRFREVQGETFHAAIRLAADLAAALGIELEEATRRVGRALQDPETGLRGLRNAGLRLTEQQIDLAKRLKNTGDVAGAQRVVLPALERSIGGAAAGENVGLYGATRGLSKAWDDLLKAMGARAAPFGATFINRITRDVQILARTIRESGVLDALLAFVTFGRVVPQPGAGGSVTSGIIRGAREAEELAARIGALQQRLDQAQEHAARVAKIMEERKIALGKVAAESALANEQQLAEQRLQVLELYHSQGLLSTRDFFATRREILATAMDAEVRAINQKMEEEARALDLAKQAGDPSAQIRALAELHKLIDERARIQARAGAEMVKSTLEEGRAADALAQTRAAAEIRLLELQGRRSDAALQALDAEIEQWEKLLRLQGASQAEIAAKAAEVRAAGVRGLEIEQLQERADRALRELEIDRQRILHQVEQGLLMQFQGEEKLIALERGRLPILREIAQRMADIAVTDEQILKAKEFAAALDEIAVNINKAGREAAAFNEGALQAVASGLSEFLTSGIDQAENFSQAVRKMAFDIVQSLRRMSADIVAMKIAEAIFSFFGFPLAVPRRAQGGIVERAGGGSVRGQGTGTSDSIPALLSDGEFVVRAAAVRQPGVRSLLDMINRGMAPVRPFRVAFAEGGLVSGGLAGPGAHSTLDSSLTVKLGPGLLADELRTPEGQRVLVQAIARNKRAIRGGLGS